MNSKILLVGAGPMAVEYVKVLKALEIEFSVAGRGRKSAEAFFVHTGFAAMQNGIEYLIENNRLKEYSAAIVAVSENNLGKVTRCLIDAGVKKILVEKPGGLDKRDIQMVAETACDKQAQVFVGYNRRKYASVERAREIIREDGGVTSFDFEFTEWSHVIRKLEKADGVKEEWFLANSSHVVDLAFYLCGRPKKLYSYVSGKSDWHPRAMIYAGSGVGQTGALFTYKANWESPGRWGIEILTKNHRLYLKPLEELQIQEIGSVKADLVEIADEKDLAYKPGLFMQVKDFLQDNCDLLTIQEQCEMLHFYDTIENGGRIV